VTKIDVPAVIAGVLLSLGLIVPVALIARLVAGGDLSSGWDVGFTIFIFIATFIGAGVAGRRQPDTPMIHGAAAGALTYIGARVVSAIVSGEMPNIIGLILALMIFAAVGAIAGRVATMLVERSEQEPRP
jgi:putative membrane protein (TIGR04086 family)